MTIHVDLDLPQWDLPLNEPLRSRISTWEAEFWGLHDRMPTFAEVVEWAYQEGVKEGKSQ